MFLLTIEIMEFMTLKSSIYLGISDGPTLRNLSCGHQLRYTIRDNKNSKSVSISKN